MRRFSSDPVLTPEMASSDPQRYIAEMLVALSQTTRSGALVWNGCVSGKHVTQGQLGCEGEVYMSQR